MWIHPLRILGIVFLLTAVYFAVYLPPEFLFSPSALGISLIAVDIEEQKLKDRLEKLESTATPPVTEEG